MYEKRLTDRLAKYWTRLKGEKIMPEVHHFNTEVVHDLWPRCLLLEVVNHVQNRSVLYTYDYMGKEITDAYGNDLTGQYVNMHMHHFPGWQILKSVDKVVQSPEIVYADGNFVSDMHQVIKYRACLLPFGKDTKVSHVLVGLSWKAF